MQVYKLPEVTIQEYLSKNFNQETLQARKDFPNNTAEAKAYSFPRKSTWFLSIECVAQMEKGWQLIIASEVM